MATTIPTSSLGTTSTSSLGTFSLAGVGSISSPGVGSGLDVNSIVSKLMAIEQQPLQALQQTETTYQTQLSAYGTLKSAISDFQTALTALDTPDAFKLYTTSSSDPSIFTATADSSAAPGSYGIQVTQLATAEKWGATNSVADASSTTVGAAGDTMTITVGGNSFTVDVGGKTLNDIRDAINSASGNTGVTASVVEADSTHYYLTLTSNDTGTANAINSVTYSGTDPLGMVQKSAATDATVQIDGASGYTVTRSTNTITDAIQGVTLNLTAADASNSYTLTVSRDVSGVQTKVQAFVDAYNKLMGTVKSLESGALQGDNTLLSIENQIRDVINTPPTAGTSSFSYLAQVGVTLDKNGVMQLNSDAVSLSDALNQDFNGVANLFGASGQGYADRLNSLANDYLTTGTGLIDTAESGINSEISTIKDQITSMQDRLNTVQQNYLAQFTALDTLMSNLQVTSNYLTQQLQSLPTKG